MPSFLLTVIMIHSRYIECLSWYRQITSVKYNHFPFTKFTKIYDCEEQKRHVFTNCNGICFSISLDISLLWHHMKEQVFNFTQAPLDFQL